MAGNVLSIRLICNRVLLRMSHDESVMISELDLYEAMTIRSLLDGAIAQLEQGDSQAPDFETFLAVLNRS